VSGESTNPEVDHSPLAELPLYTASDTGPGKRLPRLRWHRWNALLVGRQMIWLAAALGALAGAVAAARVSGPEAPMPPNTAFLLGAGIGGGAIGAGVGWWLGQRAGRHVSEAAECGPGLTMLVKPSIGRARMVATTVTSVLIIAPCAAVMFGVGLGIALAFGYFTPVLTVALAAAALGFDASGAITQATVVRRWEHTSGARLLEQVRRPRRSRAEHRYGKTYGSNRVTLDGSRCSITLAEPPGANGPTSFDQLLAIQQWQLLSGARRWADSATVAERAYAPGQPGLALLASVSLAQDGRTEEALDWYLRARNQGLPRRLPPSIRQALRPIRRDPRYVEANR